MKNILVLILVQLVIVLPNIAQSNEQASIILKVENCLSPSPEEGVDITWSIDERMKYHNVPAVSVAVIENYEIAWAKAYGWADKEEKNPATTETLFQAASISKSINALGILNWVETESIDLNSDFSEHLNSWNLKSRKKANNKKITLANLLSHTAGLNGHGFDGYEIDDKIPTTLQILNGKRPANSKRIESETEPNKEFKYSGGGIMITQQIISEYSGISYDKYMYRNILTSIGMNKSTFNQQPIKENEYASAYWTSGNRLKGRYHLYPEMAAAGLWSTPIEISRFIIEIQKSYLGESNKLISKKITQKMLAPHLKDGTTGLGVFLEDVNDKKYFTHGGSNEGFKCYYYGSIEGGNGIVIMTNSESFDIIPEIIRSIFKVYQW